MSGREWWSRKIEAGGIPIRPFLTTLLQDILETGLSDPPLFVPDRMITS
jgi:hypothetical protein